MSKKAKYVLVVIAILVATLGSYEILRRYPKNYMGIPVPPRPYAIINNWTLAGVDTNHNGVRDDVERYIAQAVNGDLGKYMLALEYERKLEDLMLNPSREKIIRQHCEVLQVDQQSRNAIVKASQNWFNTKIRWDRNTEIYTGIFRIPECGPNLRP